MEDLESWLDEEAPSKPIVLARSVQTCFGCPSQWDAWTSDGKYLYLRFRWGSGTVDNDQGETIASFDTDDKWAGVIDLDEFCACAGLQLADDHERA
ncbi:hypothetical protein [Streptomyces antibioticus]|uniref:Uncharacterized protein n=1 Tax=Streptomyces antibioticus TaxID=1890 RepID=A0AAE6YFZ9_STRAT|nr:hypothetical protein [Streptomyces antibioticus]OOQ47295.1 hypothetical protein AFM16_31640 [Streptomyces antibioticus]QIT49188.1 hypothetical protein HCX60_32195 [Streptomyces antibioticus]